MTVIRYMLKSVRSLNTGDIGIFMVNNECFIKEAGENGLISHNKKYPIIPGSKHIICVGKVLGKVGNNIFCTYFAIRIDFIRVIWYYILVRRYRRCL